MAKRKRDIQLKFRVTPQEREMIETKMAQFGTTNMAAYLRKMAIDGHVVKLDLPELRELVSLLRYSSNSLNHLTRRTHETGRIYEADPEDILNKAYRKSDPKTGETVERSKKTLTNIRATIHAFFKMRRLKKVSTLFPENLSIPKGARYKGTKILQPQDLITLFSTDTTTLYGKPAFDDFI